jgi:hypothetical protein
MNVTMQALLSPAGGGAVQHALCAALHMRLAAQQWPHSASVAQSASYIGFGDITGAVNVPQSTALTPIAQQASSPESVQHLQHQAQPATPPSQHTCDQLPQQRQFYSALKPQYQHMLSALQPGPGQLHSAIQPQPCGLHSISLQQHHLHLQGCRQWSSTSSSQHSTDTAAAAAAAGEAAAAGRAVGSSETTPGSPAAEARDSAAHHEGFSSPGTRKTAAEDDALYPDEGEVLLDEWEEPEVRLDSSSGMLDAEWTGEGAVSTSSHVEEFEDSADEYDVEFDEDFDFEDEEALQDNLPASSDGRESGV